MCLGNDSCRRPQDDLSRALLGPPFHLSYRYAQLLVTYYIVMLYGTGMPLLYPISCVSFVVTYWWVVWVARQGGRRAWGRGRARSARDRGAPPHSAERAAVNRRRRWPPVVRAAPCSRVSAPVGLAVGAVARAHVGAAPGWRPDLFVVNVWAAPDWRPDICSSSNQPPC